jgi:LacI family transcriptional regulator
VKKVMSKSIKPVKLEDLAKKLGVSKVTISKALRDHPDISPAMKIKVKELAEKVGYLPNFMARSLSSRKSNIIGVVVPKIAHFFFASVIESIYDSALENNYDIVLTVSQELAERERKHILSLLSMKVDGLIISVTQETTDTSIFTKVMNHKIPLVFIDRVPNLPDVSSVIVDDEGGAYSAVEHFIKNGFTKIGHVGGYHHINIGYARYRGFQKAMNKYKIPLNKNWITEGGFGEEDGYNGFRKILEKGTLPQAILAVTYPVALGIHEAALEKGIRIPEDIQVTCFGSNNFKHQLPSLFNFVDQPTTELGKQSVHLLKKLIENPSDRDPVKVVLKTRLLLKNNLKDEQVA